MIRAPDHLTLRFHSPRGALAPQIPYRALAPQIPYRALAPQIPYRALAPQIGYSALVPQVAHGALARRTPHGAFARRPLNGAPARWVPRGAAIALLALVTPPALVHAQAWPAKPIRMIIPFPPGGATDLIGRLSAQRLTESLGQAVVVENRGGAGGSIGTELGMKAAPDGYTLTFSVASYAVNPSLYKLAFDPVKDIQPIIQLSDGPLLLAVHPSVPVKTVRELIALARRTPGGLNYSTSGQGTISHLTTEHFMAMAGVRMTHIPYKGTAPALADTVAGHVALTFGNVFATLPLTRSGKLRAIAVTGSGRISGDRSIPTVAESGVPGFDLALWHGLLGPRGLPRPITDRLNAELNRVLKTREMIDRLEGDGLSPVGGTPEQFGERIARDIALYRTIVAKAGIKAD